MPSSKTFGLSVYKTAKFAENKIKKEKSYNLIS